MNEIIQYFSDVFLVTMRDALILLLDEFLKIKLGCSLALAIPCSRQKFSRANPMQVSFLNIRPVADEHPHRLYIVPDVSLCEISVTNFLICIRELTRTDASVRHFVGKRNQRHTTYKRCMWKTILYLFISEFHNK